MHILVPELQQLSKKYGMQGFFIGPIYIAHDYAVGVSLQAGKVKVALFNGLLSQNQPLSLPIVSDAFLFLDDKRKIILKVVEENLIFRKNFNKEQNPIDEGGMHPKEKKMSHEEIEQEYKIQFLLAHEELTALHMFFSPSAVPRGLTEKEVRMCVMLSSFRKRQATLHVSSYPPNVHPSVLVDFHVPISRDVGLKNTIYDLFIELANHRPSSNS